MAPKGQRSGRQARKAWASRRESDGADSRAFNKPAVGAEPLARPPAIQIADNKNRQSKWIRKDAVGPGVKPEPKPKKDDQDEGSFVAAMRRATKDWRPPPCKQCGGTFGRVWNEDCNVCSRLHSVEQPATEADAALFLAAMADANIRHPSLMMGGTDGMFEAIVGTQRGYYARKGVYLAEGKWQVLNRIAKELPRVFRPESRWEGGEEPQEELIAAVQQEEKPVEPEERQVELVKPPVEPQPEEQPATDPAIHNKRATMDLAVKRTDWRIEPSLWQLEDGEQLHWTQEVEVAPERHADRRIFDTQRAFAVGTALVMPEDGGSVERMPQMAVYWPSKGGGRKAFRTHTAHIPRRCQALVYPGDEALELMLEPWWCSMESEPSKPSVESPLKVPTAPDYKRIAEIRQWKRSWTTIDLGFGWEPPPFAKYPGVVAKWYEGRTEMGPDAAHLRMGALGFFGRLQVNVGCLGAIGAAFVEARREVMQSVPINKSTILYRRLGAAQRNVRGGGEVAGAIPLEALGQIQTKTGVFVVQAVRRIFANGFEYECAGLKLVQASLRLLQNPFRKVCDWATGGLVTDVLVGSQAMSTLSVRGTHLAQSQAQCPGKLDRVRVEMNLLRCNKNTPEHLRGIMADLVSSVSAMPADQMERVVPLKMAEWVYERDQAVREACGDYVPFSLRA